MENLKSKYIDLSFVNQKKEELINIPDFLPWGISLQFKDNPTRLKIIEENNLKRVYVLKHVKRNEYVKMHKTDFFFHAEELVRFVEKYPQFKGVLKEELLNKDIINYESITGMSLLEIFNKEGKYFEDKIYNKYKRIDVLINNAGISANKKIEDTTSEEFMHIMDININAMYNTSKAVTIYMKKQGYGVILNTSSMVSKYGQPSGIGYPTSKFAVNGFTLSLARELASYNIRVNAVAPGITNTDMVKKLPQEMIEPLIKSIPLGRIGEPKDIANAYLFLASDMASYITGVILSVDGLARS